MSITNESDEKYWKLNVEDNNEIYFKNPSRVEYGSWYSGDDGYRVGIGITNPSVALDVSGDINFTGEILQNNNRVDDWGMNGTHIYNVNTGNVGIGTTSPTTALLTIGDTTNQSQPLINFNTERPWTIGQGNSSGASTSLILHPIDAANNNKDFIISSYDENINYLRVRSNATAANGFVLLAESTDTNVGIGVAVPDEKLHIEGEAPVILLTNTLESAGPTLRFADSSAIDTQNFDFTFDAASQHFKIRSDDTDNIMTYNINGNVGLGITAANVSYQLELSTDSAAKPTSSTWTISSDRRVKEDIKDADLDICYKDVKKLKLRHFKWNEEYIKQYKVEDKHNLGFIAQEVEKVNKSAVNTKENKVFGIEDFKTINKDQLIMSLYGAVQKLQQITEKQQKTINILSQCVKDLQLKEDKQKVNEFDDTINIRTDEEVFSFSKVLTNKKTYTKCGKIPVYVESLNSTKYITIWD